MRQEYKTICDRCSQGTWYETEQPCKRTIQVVCKTCGHGTEKYKRCTGTLRVISNDSLTPQLVGLEGYRVEVVTDYDEKRRFIVGKSTGWKPCHIEVSRKSAYGGPAAEKHYKSVLMLYKVR